MASPIDSIKLRFKILGDGDDIAFSELYEYTTAKFIVALFAKQDEDHLTTTATDGSVITITPQQIDWARAIIQYFEEE